MFLLKRVVLLLSLQMLVLAPMAYTKELNEGFNKASIVYTQHMLASLKKGMSKDVGELNKHINESKYMQEWFEKVVVNLYGNLGKEQIQHLLSPENLKSLKPIEVIETGLRIKLDKHEIKMNFSGAIDGKIFFNGQEFIFDRNKELISEIRRFENWASQLVKTTSVWENLINFAIPEANANPVIFVVLIALALLFVGSYNVYKFLKGESDYRQERATLHRRLGFKLNQCQQGLPTLERYSYPASQAAELLQDVSAVQDYRESSVLAHLSRFAEGRGINDCQTLERTLLGGGVTMGSHAARANSIGDESDPARGLCDTFDQLMQCYDEARTIISQKRNTDGNYYNPNNDSYDLSRPFGASGN